MTQDRNISNSNFRIEESLQLSKDEVQLWRVDLEAIGGEESTWRQALSSDELARAGRFHFARDRQRFMACRAMLRKILAAYLNADAKELRFAYSKKEKPSLVIPAGHDIAFNVAHSSSVALLAFTRGRNIGVDVEQLRRDFDPDAIAKRFFSEYERKQLAALPPEEQVEAFFRCWTRKEAYMKATGEGLSLPLTQFDVSLATGEKNALLATRPDPNEAQGWSLQEIPSGPGFVAALCVQGRDWKLSLSLGDLEHR